MSDLNEKKLAIIGTLKEKSLLKQKVYDNTFESFSIVKDVLRSLSKELNASLVGTDSRIRLEYTDRSNFDAQIKVAGDILLFSTPTSSSSTEITLHGKQLISRKINTMLIPV
jgi:hypothetical protein